MTCAEQPHTYMRRLYLWWEAMDAVRARRGEPPLGYDLARRWFECELEPEDAAAAIAPSPVVEIKQGHRPHFIPQWAQHLQLMQKDIVREVGVDKGVVSRWFSGSTPSVKYQKALAALFKTQREYIFRHPDEVGR